MGVKFNLLDTALGDRVLDAAAIAAMQAADPSAVSGSSLDISGNAEVDGNLTLGGGATMTGPVKAAYVAGSVATGLSGAGTTRADATQLAAAINVMSTVVEGSGAILPAAATVGIGGSVDIYNNGAGELQVYATGSETVDGIAGATGVNLTEALRCRYTVLTATTWISAQLGAISV